jgi:hypothetical protein
LFEDFLRAPSDTTVTGFETINDGATGTCTYQDAAAGIFNIVTAAADNDYQAFASVNEIFNLGLAKKMWFEARLKIAEATTNESTWWCGLTDTTTTGGMQANTGGPLADFDGVLIYKTPETALTLNMMVSNGTTQTSTTTLGSEISDTWIRVGFKYNGDNATTGTITPYYSVDGSSALAAGTALTFLLASMTASELVLGVKAGPTAAAETLQVDYVRCLQLR